MKKRYFLVLGIIFLTGCQEEKSVLSDWQSSDGKKQITLKKGKIGLNEKSFHVHGRDESCIEDIKVQGKENMGKIQVLRKKDSHCHKKEVPTKMSYFLKRGRMRVCSDYPSGEHTCEQYLPAKSY